MFDRSIISKTMSVLLGGILSSGILVLTSRAQTSGPDAKPSVTTGSSRYRPNAVSKREELHYGIVWGVGSLVAKWTESGEIIRFSYTVLDANRAKALSDKKAEPSLIDPGRGVKLVVPALENVGSLRQSSTPEVGKSYWMAFSNSGRVVKRGDQVSVVIGQFRADGLVVE
jgi:hypothetical protein